MSLLAYVKSTFENNAHQVDNIIAPYPSTLTGSHLSLGSTVWYVVEAILNDGIRNGKNINGKFVMRWEWYNTEYLAKVLFFTNSCEQNLTGKNVQRTAQLLNIMKPFSGAAHGYSGIIYFILHFWDDLFLNNQLAFKLADNNMKQFLQQFGNSFKQTIWKLIINTLEYCLSFGFGDEDSMNIPAAVGDRKGRDELVHWCHG